MPNARRHLRSSSFSLGFLLERTRRKSDILTIESNLYEICDFQQAIIVMASTFLFCHARKETLRERKEAFLFPLCVAAGSLKM